MISFLLHNSGFQVYKLYELTPLEISYRWPFILIYHEACLNEQDARHREKYLKPGLEKKRLGS